MFLTGIILCKHTEHHTTNMMKHTIMLYANNVIVNKCTLTCVPTVVIKTIYTGK